jgi:hypothetical protein
MKYSSLFFIYKYFNAWFYSRDNKNKLFSRDKGLCHFVFIAAIEENPFCRSMKLQM